jgi:hypothetical protein
VAAAVDIHPTAPSARPEIEAVARIFSQFGQWAVAHGLYSLRFLFHFIPHVLVRVLTFPARCIREGP